MQLLSQLHVRTGVETDNLWESGTKAATEAIAAAVAEKVLATIIEEIHTMAAASQKLIEK